MDDKDFMNEAFKEAKKAYEKGECPVGALIVQNEIILARALLYHFEHRVLVKGRKTIIFE